MGSALAELPVQRAKTGEPTLQSTALTPNSDSPGAAEAQAHNSAWAVKEWGGKGHLGRGWADEQVIPVKPRGRVPGRGNSMGHLKARAGLDSCRNQGGAEQRDQQNQTVRASGGPGCFLRP